MIDNYEVLQDLCKKVGVDYSKTIWSVEQFIDFSRKCYQRGRANAIEECIAFIREHSGEHYIDCDGYFGGQLELAFKVDDWIEELEMLKEMKNE